MVAPLPGLPVVGFVWMPPPKPTGPLLWKFRHGTMHQSPPAGADKQHCPVKAACRIYCHCELWLQLVAGGALPILLSVRTFEQRLSGRRTAACGPGHCSNFLDTCLAGHRRATTPWRLVLLDRAGMTHPESPMGWIPAPGSSVVIPSTARSPTGSTALPLVLSPTCLLMPRHTAMPARLCIGARHTPGPCLPFIKIKPSRRPTATSFFWATRTQTTSSKTVDQVISRPILSLVFFSLLPSVSPFCLGHFLS